MPTGTSYFDFFDGAFDLPPVVANTGTVSLSNSTGPTAVTAPHVRHECDPAPVVVSADPQAAHF